MNQLILGDNLEILKSLESETIDLIYLDPPFFSNRNYEVIWGDAGEIRSFQDRWSGGIDHYIAWLKERVIEMHRLLKPTGSIFLHCDWHANAEIKVLILNKIFGESNFKNEIKWKRVVSSGSSKAIARKFPIVDDTIFFYVKSNKYTWNTQYTGYSKEYKKRFNQQDELGYFYWDNLKSYSQETLERLMRENRIKLPLQEGKNPRFKNYLHEGKGTVLDNLWLDIPPVNSQAIERIGYPTQKPEALLERIILCASNENDLILDPFVGGGTTVAVADKLKRNWIGIDQSVQAIKVSEMRLQKQKCVFSIDYQKEIIEHESVNIG